MVRWKKLLNFTCFQIGWFACAMGATGGRPLLGLLVVGVLLAPQFLLVPSPKRQCRFLLAATLLGWSVDSGLTATGVFTFPSRHTIECNVDNVFSSLSHHSDLDFTAQLVVGQRCKDILHRFNWFSVDHHDQVA